MRISLVSEHASPLALLGGDDAGGQNVHVAALATALAAAGHEVTVHTRRDDPRPARSVQYCEGVIVDHIDAGPAAPLPKDELLDHMGQFAEQLTRRWAVRRPHVVHSHFWMSGLAAVRAASPLGIPVAHTFHALGAEKLRAQGSADTSPRIRIPAETWLARSVDRVIATTAEERLTLLRWGAAPDRVTVVPCGVDVERFTPRGPQWPQRTGRARLLAVSRLVERKGLADIISALPALPDSELIIAGGPPVRLLAGCEEARRLNARATALGVADRVTLLGGVERVLVGGLIRSADVVCCTPWYEPFGLVAVEAMACGVPVVASAVGGLAETVVDGVTGCLVPPRRPGSIATAVSRILADRTIHRDMSEAATRRAAAYDWSVIAHRTATIAAELVAAGPRDRSQIGPCPVRLNTSATTGRLALTAPVVAELGAAAGGGR